MCLSKNGEETSVKADFLKKESSSINLPSLEKNWEINLPNKHLEKKKR